MLNHQQRTKLYNQMLRDISPLDWHFFCYDHQPGRYHELTTMAELSWDVFEDVLDLLLRLWRQLWPGRYETFLQGLTQTEAFGLWDWCKRRLYGRKLMACMPALLRSEEQWNPLYKQSCAPTVQPKLYVDLWTAIDHLLDQQPSAEQPHAQPILLFAEWLKRYALNSAAGHQLQTWQKEMAKYLQVDLAEVAAVVTEAMPTAGHCLVVIEPLGHQTYKVEAWLWRGEVVLSLTTTRKGQSVEEVQKWFINLKKRLGADDTVDYTIELFLPRSLFHLDFDRIKLDKRRRARRYGEQYKMVLRPWFRLAVLKDKKLAEEWTNPMRDWRKRMRTLNEAIDHEEVLWVQPTDDLDDLDDYLLEAEKVACVVLPFVPKWDMLHEPQEADDFLTVLMEHGVPAALWIREQVADDQTARLTKVAQCRPCELPQQILKERQNRKQDLSQHVMLMWDDPERIPTQYQPEEQAALTGSYANQADHLF